MEVIIPTKIRVPTLRSKISEKANTKAIAKDLDMADELREVAVVRMASYQQRITNIYNRRVRQRAFRSRYLVLRMVFENTVDPTADKFQLNWEGERFREWKHLPIAAENKKNLNKNPSKNPL